MKVKKISTWYISVLFGCIILSFSACAEENPVTDFKIKEKSDSVIITKYIGKSNIVTIPNTIKGKPVIKIDEDAFEDSVEITEVTIPSNLQEYSFSDCTSLKKVNFQEGVKVIPDNAFAFCVSLKEFLIPDTIEEIGAFAYQGCKFTEVTIPEGVTIIKEGAFEYCFSLTKVTLPESLERIEKHAFEDCSLLSEINIPENLDLDEPFHGCPLLKKYVVDGCEFFGWFIPNNWFDSDSLPSANVETGYVENVGRQTIPEGFVLVQGCSTGNFYIAKTELTYEKWHEVYQWAVGRGYVFQDLGGRKAKVGCNLSSEADPTKQPVTHISWRDAIVWCNAASEKEGLTPVYEYEGSPVKEAENYYGYAGLDKYRLNGTEVETGEGKADNSTVNKRANGYRLPTEVEWEYAARGGQNYTYSGSDDISEVAWYTYNSRAPDLHRVYYQSHDVGTKAPNGYGIYDMTGNVSELCWDLYSSDSALRVYRGGNCKQKAQYCDISYRGYDSPGGWDNGRGVRVARNAE